MLDVAIVGSGPYGLAAAAHLRAADVQTHIFGEPMGFWDRQMPEGMLLRSYWSASHIADPGQTLTLDAYQTACGRKIPRPIPLDRFIEYGRWFGEQVTPDLDRRRVERIERANGGFSMVLEDGDRVATRTAVVAGGIAPFARIPPMAGSLPPELASHSSDHRDLSRFAGKHVVVVGGGQSALEGAALLHECGARVEVIVRSRSVHWLRYGSGSKLHAALHSDRNPLKPLMYPPSDVGPPVINLLVDRPPLFKALPTRSIQDRVARRAIRPAGSGWLVERLRSVPISTGLGVEKAEPTDDGLIVKLSDGSDRRVDHLYFATGYAVDVNRYPFITPELSKDLQMTDGYPLLSPGFESSVSGLHFLGAPAALSFGPLMRFVAGTGFASRGLTRGILSSMSRRSNAIDRAA